MARARGLAAAPPVMDSAGARDALECPLCGYSLRGLVGTEGSRAQQSARCPECGYRFAWEELLRARQYRHPYLFEHHPRRNAASFVKTLAAGLRPRRFWGSLNAGHEVRPGRLVVYALVVSVLIGLSIPSGYYVGTALTILRRNLSWQEQFVGMPGRPMPPDPAFFAEVRDAGAAEQALTTWLTLGCVAWPWVTLAVLLMLRASMRRTRVRGGHVLRCVVYSGDALVWTGVVLAVGGGLGFLQRYPDPGGARRVIACVLTAECVAGYRLGVAYRTYLGFDHPWATVVASQVVYLLVVTSVMSVFYEDFWRVFW